MARTGYNLPDGVRNKDLPGNGKEQCDICEGEFEPDELNTCAYSKYCDVLTCDDCKEEHLESHQQEEGEE